MNELRQPVTPSSAFDVRLTQPYLPPLDEYSRYLEGIYDRRWLTNNGPLVRELESRLESHWGVPHVVLVANGTLAIELAARALGIRGPVLTTPFTYLATPMALERAGLQYGYAEIEHERMGLDPRSVAAQLETGAYDAVVPVHVYGNPVDPSIDETVRAAGARLLFDASHAAASRVEGHAIVGRGDASALSLHATKLLHTVEGGAVVTSSPEIRDRVAELRNFGQDEQGRIVRPGGNAKMSELHAAMGLAVLDHFDSIVSIRRELAARYAEGLPAPVQIEWYTDDHPAAYLPIVMESTELVERTQQELAALGIESRRYFWPSLEQIEVLEGDSQAPTTARDLAARVLCLPLHTELSGHDVDTISRVVTKWTTSGN